MLNFPILPSILFSSVYFNTGFQFMNLAYAYFTYAVYCKRFVHIIVYLQTSYKLSY